MRPAPAAKRNGAFRRGSALLEFALCAPILLYLLVGVADFARYYVESSQLGEVATMAAQAGVGSSTAEVESFCACPFEADAHFACGERSCGDYGEPARYTQAVAVKPFSFIGRYPGFPRNFQIRRRAGMRTR